MSDAYRISRLAGALYLVVVVTGIFSLIYVPGQIGLAGDQPATASRILASEDLFRAGIAAFLVKQVAFLLLPFALFQLLRPAHQTAALLMVVLAVVSVPLALVSLASRLDALEILTGPYAQAFTPEQLQAQAMLAIKAYGNGLLVTSLFWGLWLFPFGYLVLKSGFLPKLLGVCLMLGGLGYLTDVFTSLLAPDIRLPGFVMLPAALGEIGTCLWLLLVGVRPRPTGTA